MKNLTKSSGYVNYISSTRTHKEEVSAFKISAMILSIAMTLAAVIAAA